MITQLSCIAALGPETDTQVHTPSLPPSLTDCTSNAKSGLLPVLARRCVQENPSLHKGLRGALRRQVKAKSLVKWT